MTGTEPTNIGLSETAHRKLKRLKEDEHFDEMVDAYRCGVALALAYGALPDELPASRQNIFGVATVDPNREIFIAVQALTDTSEVGVYRMAERLADWGVMELARMAEEEGEINFADLLRTAEQDTNEAA